jgi:hypothetical protein
MDDKNIDNFSKKIFENYQMQKPSGDFTDKVMLKIEMTNKPVKAQESVFGKKFIFFFTLTFSTLIALGYFYSDKNVSGKESIIKRFISPELDLGKLFKIIDFNIEIGFMVKLIVASVIILVIIDMLTGSLIDYIIDSKAKK